MSAQQPAPQRDVAEEIDRSDVLERRLDIDPENDPTGEKRAAQHKHYFEKFYGTVEERHQNFMASQADLACGAPVLGSEQLTSQSLKAMIEAEERALAHDVAVAKKAADEALERQHALDAARLYEDTVRARGLRPDGSAGQHRPAQQKRRLAPPPATTAKTSSAASLAADAAAVAQGTFQRYHPLEAAVATKATRGAVDAALATAGAVNDAFFEQDRFRFAVTDRDEDYVDEDDYDGDNTYHQRMGNSGAKVGEWRFQGGSNDGEEDADGAENTANKKALVAPARLQASALLASLKKEMAELSDAGLYRRSRLKVPIAHPTYPSPSKSLLRNGGGEEGDDPEDDGDGDDLPIGSEDVYKHNHNYRVRPAVFAEPRSIAPAPSDLEHGTAVKVCKAKEQLLIAHRAFSSSTGGGHSNNNNNHQRTSSSSGDDDEADGEESSGGGDRANRRRRRHDPLRAGPSAVLSTFGVGRRQTEIDIPLEIQKQRIVGQAPPPLAPHHHHHHNQVTGSGSVSAPPRTSYSFQKQLASGRKPSLAAMEELVVAEAAAAAAAGGRGGGPSSQLNSRKGSGSMTMGASSSSSVGNGAGTPSTAVTDLSQFELTSDERRLVYAAAPSTAASREAAFALEANLLQGLDANVLHHPKKQHRLLNSGEEGINTEPTVDLTLAQQQEEDFVNRVESQWQQHSEGLQHVHTAVRSQRRAAEVDVEEALFQQSEDDSDGYDEDVQKEWRDVTGSIYGACRSLEYRPPKDDDGNVISPSTMNTNMALYTYSNGYRLNTTVPDIVTRGVGSGGSGGAAADVGENSTNTNVLATSSASALLATLVPEGDWRQMRRQQRIAAVSATSEDGFERFVRMLKEMADSTIAAKERSLREEAALRHQVWSSGVAKLVSELRKACGTALTPMNLSAEEEEAARIAEIVAKNEKKKRAMYRRECGDADAGGEEGDADDDDGDQPPPPPRPLDAIEADLYGLQQQFLQQFDVSTPPSSLPSPPPIDIFTPSEEHMCWDAIRFMFRDCEPLHHKQWLSNATRLITHLDFSDRPPIACVVYVLDAIVALQFRIDQKRVESAKERERLWLDVIKGGKKRRRRLLEAQKRNATMKAQHQQAKRAAGGGVHHQSQNATPTPKDDDNDDDDDDDEDFDDFGLNNEDANSGQCEDGLVTSGIHQRNSIIPQQQQQAQGSSRAAVHQLRGGGGAPTSEEGKDDDAVEGEDASAGDPAVAQHEANRLHLESLIATLTADLQPPIDTVCPSFPSCNLLRPHHLARVERWLSRSSFLVRKRIATLQALGVSEPTWAQLQVSAGGADRRTKVPTLTLGDAAAANVAYLALGR